MGLSCAARLDMIMDILNSGMLCDCPWHDERRENNFTGIIEMHKIIDHKEKCAGVLRARELLEDA